MEVRILFKSNGGTEFVPQPGRLHLGGLQAEGVDRLHFLLPEEWAQLAVTLYVEHSDGTQAEPCPLGEDATVAVDQRFTGWPSGRWMLCATSGSGYTAYSRPGRYDVYETLPVDGTEGSGPSPSVYEQFVARVLESANQACAAAQSAAGSEASALACVAQAQKAGTAAAASSEAAAAGAERAEAAARRAEQLAPEAGAVRSVNGLGGAVTLGAQQVGALPRPQQPRSGGLVRVASVEPDTGVIAVDTIAPPEACAALGAMPTAGGTFTGRVCFGSEAYYIDASGDAHFRQAYSADYNDYAELLPCAGLPRPGEILALDTASETERYVRAFSGCRRVAGVCTDEYAVLAGGPARPGRVPVALAGRVRTWVTGPVHTGDTILPSETPGVGRARRPGEQALPEQVVGYAVEGDGQTGLRRLRLRVRG